MQGEILTQNQAKEIVDAFRQSSATDFQKNRETIFDTYEKFVRDGQQWYEADKPEGNKPVLTFNHSENYIDIYGAKLFPRNMENNTLEIGVKVREKDKALKEQYENEIQETYYINSITKTIIEQTENFLVGGAACFYYPQDPTTGKAKIISLDPSICWLGWAGSKLEQFGFEDEISIAEAEKNKTQNWLVKALKNFLNSETEETKKFKKVKRFTYWNDEVQIVKVDEDYRITKNTNGFIPFSWIPNQPKAHQHEGRPETQKLFWQEKQYNERMSDFALRVKSNTKALLAITTDMDAKDIDRDKLDTGLALLQKGDDAKFLSLTENQEALDFMKVLSDKMDTKMAVNDAVNGEVKSNVSSLSMVYYFSPLMDKIAQKRVFWDEAFRELNAAILFYKFGAGQYLTTPVYQPVLLMDQTTRIQNCVMMIENGLMSVEDAIDELRGIENAGEKLKEIVEERTAHPELFQKQQPQQINDYIQI